MWESIIIIAIIALILGGAIFYIIKSKKGGKKCIGCPYCDACSKKTCNTSNEEKKA